MMNGIANPSLRYGTDTGIMMAAAHSLLPPRKGPPKGGSFSLSDQAGRASSGERAGADQRADAVGDRLAGVAHLAVQQRGLPVRHVTVRHADAQDPRYGHAGIVQRLPHGRTE